MSPLVYARALSWAVGAKMNFIAKVNGLLAKRGNGSAAMFVSALIVVILGLVLYSPVKDYVNDSLDGGSNDSLLKLIPTFWVIGVLAVAVGLSIAAFKSHK